MRVLRIVSLLALMVACWALPRDVQAGVFEFGTSFSFGKTTYSDSGEDFSWTRRFSGSIGYHFTSTSGIEFAYQLATNRTFIRNYQDTTFEDQIFSLDWIQSFMPRGSAFQPYVKLGMGQLNRKSSGSYAGGSSPPREVLALTIIMAAGIKVYLTQQFALKLEAASYLAKGSLRTFDDNFNISVGTSIFF